MRTIPRREGDRVAGPTFCQVRRCRLFQGAGSPAPRADLSSLSALRPALQTDQRAPSRPGWQSWPLPGPTPQIMVIMAAAGAHSMANSRTPDQPLPADISCKRLSTC